MLRSAFTSRFYDRIFPRLQVRCSNDQCSGPARHSRNEGVRRLKSSSSRIKSVVEGHGPNSRPMPASSRSSLSLSISIYLSLSSSTIRPTAPASRPHAAPATSAKIIVSFVARRLHMRRYAPRALLAEPSLLFLIGDHRGDVVIHQPGTAGFN